ncbi:hypothetical protein D9611_008678 [Ephemerocybe angulata]|uniref:U6 snRNA phosphodiesterase n=1 Tax=Ephemerocybe angulata TaxID=980116 RepID=A0A8H5CCW2_9AGAR|nr:hypothetical protein D9611_008678 [Tulosesus angulatus]
MKRTSLLVCYSSSEEDEKEKPALSFPLTKPPTKRRKLPPLAETIAALPPVDNPALHQGRTRNVPHVEGQYAAHVYVSITLRESSPLYQLVKDVFHDAKKQVPSLQEISKLDTGRYELHISLSRPIFLRAHQREELRQAVRNVTREQAPFTVSFASFSELVNDEKTRTFLAIEIGAGHNELKTLSDALAPALQAIRQKGYYEKPRFHASVAWALLTPSSNNGRDSLPRSESELSSETSEFPTIDRLPETLLSTLDEKYRPSLTSSRIGAFEVAEITVKIGKDVSTFRLKV